DNIVSRSERISWYDGASLLDYLETVSIEDKKTQPWRFPVQWIVRPQTEDLHDYRGYAGRVLGDGLTTGDEVVVLPSGVRSTVKSIELAEQSLDQAQNGQSVIVHLTYDMDISRGDILIAGLCPRLTERYFKANICWFDTTTLAKDPGYPLQPATSVPKVKLADVLYKID